jgi:peroxiredoxin Q/BCP
MWMGEPQQGKGRIGVGDVAPDFALPAQSGESVRLHDLLGRSAVVLFFYPKDNTAGCTAEACSFRDAYAVFQGAGAEVMGISSDSVASHQRFAARHRLPFTLLSDPGGKVRKLYGVPATFGLLPGRVTYVIDRDGTVLHVFSSQFGPTEHIGQAFQALQEAQARASAAS